MKTFAFRLDRALRWRETQSALQQARASAAAGRVAGIRDTLEARNTEIQNSAAEIVQAPTGAALASYAGFTARAQRQVRELGDQAADAQRALAAELNLLKEASRKVKLLESLKQTRLNRWQREFDREIGAFADESFLGRLQSRKRKGA